MVFEVVGVFRVFGVFGVFGIFEVFWVFGVFGVLGIWANTQRQRQKTKQKGNAKGQRPMRETTTENLNGQIRETAGSNNKSSAKSSKANGQTFWHFTFFASRCFPHLAIGIFYARFPLWRLTFGLRALAICSWPLAS